MLTKNLYNDILIAPAQKDATLYIVSGYATAGMVARHINNLQSYEKIPNVHIRLIIGMTAKDGITETNHKGLYNITSAINYNFQCGYVQKNQPPVHTKAYAWFDKNKSPLKGFIGSANYTQNGFFSKQEETMEESNPLEILKYYKQLEKLSCSCLHSDVQGLIKEDKDAVYIRENSKDSNDTSHLECVRTSLLSRSGDLPQRSGLNWGQRPELGRELNQAYIRIPIEVVRKGFFPKRYHHFTLHTDDNQTMLCAICQDGGKAIETPNNNSLIGKYFRYRLGVELGAPVTKDHLLSYGRTDITFYKIDDENYQMDFSVKK